MCTRLCVGDEEGWKATTRFYLFIFFFNLSFSLPLSLSLSLLHTHARFLTRIVDDDDVVAVMC